MFKKLKEKLQSWVKKTENDLVETEPIEEVVEEKKVTKTKEKKSKEKVPKEIEEVIEEISEEIEEEEPKKEKFFEKFKRKLTSEQFEESFEELELVLIQNNVALEAIESLKKSLEEKLVGKNLSEVDISKELRSSIEELLINPPNFIETVKNGLKEKKPFVILFVGINGSGKTTTLSKVASMLKKEDFSVCVAAADTFRAASIEQLQEHANKLDIHLIKKDYGSDPASVGFDAVNYAKKNSVDVVLIDTAGRLQNKDSLMKEIEKIFRVNSPDMKIFVGEAITGNDATLQAKSFNESVGLTGIILSKSDVDESGGTAISVSYITKKPILFLGTGQNYENLEVFDKNKVLEKLGL